MPLWERLFSRRRKRPLTMREKFFRGLFVLVIGLDLLLFYFGYSIVSGYFAPKTYVVGYAIGFALPNTPYGFYDIATFENVSGTSPYGYQFFPTQPLFISVEAIVNNPDFNATANGLYFSFENAQMVNPVTKACGPTQEPAPLGIRVFKYRDGVPSYWSGSGFLCFLYGGEFTPVFTVVEPNKTYSTGFFRLHEGVGQRFVLDISPAQNLQEFFLNSINIFLTFGLYAFGGLESYHVLTNLYPKAFPYRIQYEKQEVRYFDSNPDPGQ